MTFDYGKLVNALTNNNQKALPPNDVIRMGQVVGYDPNWDSTILPSGAHSYPMVSVQLAGDSAPMHGFRFAENYVPNLGDTVWCVLSGEDGFVLCSLAGANKDTIGQLRSPSSIIGISSTIESSLINGTAPYTDGSTVSVASFAAPFLPNRLYRAEGTITFTVDHGSPGGGSFDGRSSFNITATGMYPNNGLTGATTPSAVSFVGHWNYNRANGEKQLVVDVGSATDVQSLIDLSGEAVIVGPNINNVDRAYGTTITTNAFGCGTASMGVVLIRNNVTPADLTPRATFPLSGLYGAYDPVANSTGASCPIPYQYTVLNDVVHVSGTATSSTTGSFVASRAYSEVVLSVVTPDSITAGDDVYYEMARVDVTGLQNTEAITLNGFTTYWKTPSAPITPNSWTSLFDWRLTVTPAGDIPDNYPTVSITEAHFILYDCGVAS